jgi:Mat/Ecp fimbriae outer membrane usher protein
VWRRWLCYLLAVRTLSYPLLSQAQSRPKTTIYPKQVQNFLPTDPPREDASTMLFDLYLGDSLKGHILADFTESWCKIQNPHDLVEQLGEVSDPNAIESLATGVIHGKKEAPNIGGITCTIETFRIVLQLDQGQLQAKQLRLTGFLPDPPDDLAVRSDVRTAFSREVDGTENGSLNLRSTTSLGRSWFTFDGTSIKDHDLEVNDLSLTSAGAISGHSISGGLLRTDGFPFAGSIDFIGTTIRTADEILMNPDVVRGSRLEIFVPSRSRVEFYRGSRLLSVQILDFGLQEIDTAAFPQGSYFVDILMRQLNGQVTREQQFFTKSGLLTRVDQPAFTFQVGSARDGLDFEPSPVYQAGMRWRSLSFLEIESSFAGNDTLGIGYLDFFGLYDSVTFGAGVSRSTDGGTGINTNLSGSLLGLNFGGFYTESLATLEKDEDSGELTPFDPTTPSRITGSSLLNQLDQGRRNLSSFISKRIDDAELRFSLNVNEREDANRRVTYGPIFQWNLINSSENNLRLELSRLYSTEGENTTGLLYFLHRLDRWGFSHQITGREKDSRFLSSVNYDGRQASGRGTQFRGANEIASRNDTTTSNIVDLQNTSRYAQSRFFLNDQRGAAESGTSLGANLEVSATVDESGKVSVANAVTQESLFIATIEGNGATAPVELVVNGTVYDVLEPGNELFIGLTPYQSYRVSIRPLEGSELVGYEADIVEFTVFPGNIVRKTWKLERIFIGLGRVVDSEGNPLPNVRIRGLKEYVATGEDGSFQAEMTGNEKLTIERSDGSCQITLPTTSQIDYFYDFGSLVCSVSLNSVTQGRGQK